VPVSHPYFVAIEFVKNKEIVQGYPDQTFRPDNQINRAEFAKILINAKFVDQVPEKIEQSCFPDFGDTEWFAQFVCFAKEKEILHGYPDKEFKPANSINLAETAKIITGVFEFEVRSHTENEEWFEPHLEFLIEQKILPENLTQPDKEISRAEFAEIIMNCKL
jgi:poly-beta-1,6-N-acetyl-D-glucosamine N-deacetylase